MLDETKLDLEDWADDRFGKLMTEDYKRGFNDSLFLIRSEIRNAVCTKDDEVKG